MISDQVFAQSTFTQTIRGQVIDKQTRVALPGANVVVIDSLKFRGTATDEKGYFRIENVPVGRHRVKISYVGYREIMIPVLLSSAKEAVLTVELEESVIQGKEVVVTARQEKNKANNEMTTVSARSFTIEETQRYAGTWQDPARMAASYAGVVGANDTRNDIIIRGNSPSGVLWRLEGVDIPNPNHFAAFGTTGGPVSILNNNTLANSDFLTGAFPAEYGNALAGVFDLKMRNGNNEKREFIGQAGLNGFELGAEGPFTKNKHSSYMLTYRYSTLEFFDMLGIHFGTSAIPHYQDAALKLNFPLKKGALSIFGIGGVSHISVLESERDTTDWSFGLAGYDVRFATGMGVAGVSHTHLFNNSTYLKTVAAASGNTMSSSTDSITPSRAKHPTYRNKSKEGRLTLMMFLNKKFTSRSNLKAGFQAERISYDYLDSSLSWQYKTFTTLRNFSGYSYLIQPYIQWKYKFTDQLVLNTGIHYLYYTYNESSAVEPRGGISWTFRPLHTLSLGGGMHSQMQMGYVYFHQVRDAAGNLFRVNKNIGLTRSNHLVFAYDYTISENMRLKAESYYQSISDAPVNANARSPFSMLNQGADYNFSFPDTLGNTGKGTNYGAELTVERFFHKGYYFLMTGSLFQSFYEGSDKIKRNTAFNGNYTFSALGGGEIKIGKGEKAQSVLTLDSKFTLVGGKRYTPIDMKESAVSGYAVYVEEQTFEKKFPDYFRFDFKIGYRRNGKKTSQTWFLDVQNVFNTKNILLQVYDRALNSLRNEYQLGLFPVALYRIEF